MNILLEVTLCRIFLLLNAIYFSFDNTISFNNKQTRNYVNISRSTKQRKTDNVSIGDKKILKVNNSYFFHSLAVQLNIEMNSPEGSFYLIAKQRKI